MLKSQTPGTDAKFKNLSDLKTNDFVKFLKMTNFARRLEIAENHSQAMQKKLAYQLNEMTNQRNELVMKLKLEKTLIERQIMKDTPKNDEWETYCDECYYHMWRVRRKNERGFNDGYHLNNGNEAKDLVGLLNNLEMQRHKLSEALERILDYQGRFAEEEPESIAREALKSLAPNK